MVYYDNQKSIDFANKVSDKVTEKYKEFLIQSDLHELGCSSEDSLVKAWLDFKSTVDNGIVINHELICFN